MPFDYNHFTFLLCVALHLPRPLSAKCIRLAEQLEKLEKEVTKDVASQQAKQLLLAQLQQHTAWNEWVKVAQTYFLLQRKTNSPRKFFGFWRYKLFDQLMDNAAYHYHYSVIAETIKKKGAGEEYSSINIPELMVSLNDGIVDNDNDDDELENIIPNINNDNDDNNNDNNNNNTNDKDERILEGRILELQATIVDLQQQLTNNNGAGAKNDDDGEEDDEIAAQDEHGGANTDDAAAAAAAQNSSIRFFQDQVNQLEEELATLNDDYQQLREKNKKLEEEKKLLRQRLDEDDTGSDVEESSPGRMDVLKVRFEYNHPNLLLCVAIYLPRSLSVDCIGLAMQIEKAVEGSDEQAHLVTELEQFPGWNEWVQVAQTYFLLTGKTNAPRKFFIHWRDYLFKNLKNNAYSYHYGAIAETIKKKGAGEEYSSINIPALMVSLNDGIAANNNDNDNEDELENPNNNNNSSSSSNNNNNDDDDAKRILELEGQILEQEGTILEQEATIKSLQQQMLANSNGAANATANVATAVAASQGGGEEERNDDVGGGTNDGIGLPDIHDFRTIKFLHFNRLFNDMEDIRKLNMGETVDKWNLENFKFDESKDRIGTGGFSEVFRASVVNHSCPYKIQNTCIVAIKRISKEELKADDLTSLCQEILNQHSCRKCSNTIGIYGYLSDEKYVYLILEYAPGGSLRDVLNKEKTLTPKRAAQIIKNLSKTIHGCHHKCVTHRDIKPDNLLCGLNDDVYKIADFGISHLSQKGEMCKSGSCTPEYAAPEILSGELHGEAVDVYAMGILLYEILTGKTPFDSNKTNHEEWENEVVDMIKKGEIEQWHDIPEDAKDLILKMLKKDPKERISLKEIFRHYFITSNI